MDFSFDDEQLLIRQTLQKMLREQYSYARRVAVVESEAGWDEALWSRLAEHGFLGMFLNPELGGSGAGAVEALIVMQLFGEAQSVEPYLLTSVVGARLLNALGPAPRVARLAEDLLSGRARFAMAAEDLERSEGNGCPRALRFDAGNLRLAGEKRIVLGTNGASHYLLPLVDVRAASSQILLAVIPVGKPGLEVRSYRLHDGTRGADLTFCDVLLEEDECLVSDAFGLEVYRSACDYALLGICAEAIGCMEPLLEQTVSYTKARRQFGTTLSSFQVLQHVMADMWMQLEQASALVQGAAGLLAQSDPSARPALAAAKAFVGRAGRFIGQKAMQLHGAIGLTTALPLGQYVKRLTAIELLLGTPDQHEQRFAAERYDCPAPER